MFGKLNVTQKYNENALFFLSSHSLLKTTFLFKKKTKKPVETSCKLTTIQVKAVLKELRGRNSRHFLLLFKLCSLWSLLKRVMKVEEDLVKALTDGNEHVLYSYNFCLFFIFLFHTHPHIQVQKKK